MEYQHNYNSELVDVVLEGIVRNKTNPDELKKLAKQAAEGFYRSVSIEAMQGEQDQIQIEFYKGVHALEKFIELDGDKSAAKKAVLTAVPAKAKKEVTKLIDMAFKTMKESNSLDGNQLTEGEEDVREIEDKIEEVKSLIELAMQIVSEMKQPDDKAEKGDTTLDDVADGGNEGAKKMKKDFDPKKAEDGGDGVKKAEENSDKETAGVKKAPARRGDNDIGAPKTPEKPKAPKTSMREAWESVQNYGKE